MISRCVVGATLVASLAFGPGVGASDLAPASFVDLLEGFGEGQGFEARFEEEKYLSLLAAPLRSRGRLIFEPPATLFRSVESPQPQEILVTRTHVKISDAEGDRIIDLSGLAGVRPLIESMIWIFTGDRESLERIYDVDYRVFELTSEAGQRWQLALVPKRAPLSELIRELRIGGSGRIAETMDLEEVTGDRTLTRIMDTKPREPQDAGGPGSTTGEAAR